MTLLADVHDARDCVPLAERAMALVRRIHPLPRSITGDGVRATLAAVAECVPLDVHEVPSGERAFDWEVPPEWNVRDAYIADASGRRVVDFRRNNLHVVGYSVPVRARMPLAELRAHLHTLPDRPDWIPYRTSYYTRTWGFCLAHRELERLPDGDYDVVIDADLQPGSLTYAEACVRGASDDEVLIWTHTCHPSLANDNVTGIAVAAVLAAALASSAPRLSYRFVFAPGTIGSITWLARHRERAMRLRAGLVIGLLGDRGPLTYKRSRRGDTEIDRLAAAVVRDAGGRDVPFSPYGYDERQFCSPGFDLPIGRLTRSPNGAYPEYHTSADDLDLIGVEPLADSMLALIRIVRLLDSNRRFVNLSPHTEPRLGKRGLFRATGGTHPAQREHALLWLLNQSDGSHGLNDIGVVSALPAAVLAEAAEALVAAGLLHELDGPAALAVATPAAASAVE